jgi:uncharacterized phage protein (TIGR02218 family)
LDSVSIRCKITSLDNNILTCDFTGIEDNYFKGGKLIMQQSQARHEFQIISHIQNNIEIILREEFKFNEQAEVTLIPQCDKNYRTCCYSFNNAVNFRGEPAIPEFNVIKN